MLVNIQNENTKIKKNKIILKNTKCSKIKRLQRPGSIESLYIWVGTVTLYRREGFRALPNKNLIGLSRKANVTY